MQNELLHEAAYYKKQNRRRSVWRKFVRFMAYVVVFCTTYALILPAITAETAYICGKEAHTHKAACYAADEITLICQLSEHTHSKECQPVSELTEEESLQVQAVIAQIDVLPTADEIDAVVAAYEEAEDYEAEEMYLTQAYAAVNQAYAAYSQLGARLQPKVTNALKLMELEYIWSMSTYEDSADSSAIEEELNGDYAYISNLVIKSTVDGTVFDDEQVAGSDVAGDNGILCTFDTVTYTFTFQTALRETVSNTISGYAKGRLYFEFVLPYSEEEAAFETESMLWLQTAQDIRYEIVVAENVGQVLRGSFMLVPSGDAPAVGASTNDLTVTIRALQMSNGETIAPSVTLWLEHNQVGTNYENGIPTSVVTGTNISCTTEGHGVEYKTLELPEITISAAPKYNVVLRAPNTSREGVFDFSSTDVNIPNYDKGTISGRIGALGIIVEINGDGNRMRGVELPSDKHPITFTIDLSSEFKPASDTVQTSEDIDVNYQPLFYSGSGNTYGDTGTEMRSTNDYGGYNAEIPYNKLGEEKALTYNSCFDGGTWTFTQNTENPSQIVVEITDFVFNTEQFPQTASSSSINSTTYYDPNQIDHWWEIDRAIFTAGEVWVVQPHYSTDGNNRYIVDAYQGVEGQFNVTAAVSGFTMTSATGEQVTTQVLDTDDSKEYAEYLKNPGSVAASIAYRKNERSDWDEPLTDGCFYTDRDWATPGTKMEIFTMVTSSNGTNEYRPVAIDQLIKWDDEFFEPEKAKTSNSYYFGEVVDGVGWESQYTILWGAKADGTGWTDDEDMKKATVDDLVWYSSLEELKTAGKTPLAALQEGRGLKIERANNIMFYVIGEIKADCPVNQVYMAVQNSYMWRMCDVDDLVAAHYNKEVTALTEAEYIDYMQDVFPSQADDAKQMLNAETGAFDQAYPIPTWRQDYRITNSRGYLTEESSGATTNMACALAAKPQYENGTYISGSGQQYYQDSCLVIPYKSTITKETAQYDSGSTETPKTAYDMNQGQRVVDFVLTPKIKYGSGYAGAQTVGYVEDTLPAGLTYIAGSSYLGGEYTQDPTLQSKGTVTGGTPESDIASDGYYLNVITTENADGTTTIKWTFPITLEADTDVWTEPIYYACTIGTPGDETTDVQNADVLTNTVKFWTDGETQREYKAAYGNIATYSVTVQKLEGLSLAKLADQFLFNHWEPVGFTLNVGNNAGTVQRDVLIVESLPYNGINGTVFHGSLMLTEFSAGSAESDAVSDEILSSLQFYYTTNGYYADIRSEDLQGVEFAADPATWIPLKLSDDPNTEAGRPYGLLETADGTAFPAGVDQTSQIVAIVAVGDLPANATLKMHVSLQLIGGAASDTLVNYLSQGSLVSYAKTTAVNRVLEGLTWKDANLNYMRDDSEDLISGVQVSLLKLEDDAYVPVYYPDTETPVVIETGQKVDIQSGEQTITGYNQGYYRFTGLDAGTYAVKFASGSHDISPYMACRPNFITDDTRDSDGVATYNDDGTLAYTMVKDIQMKEVKELTSGTGEALNNDSGFAFVYYELPATGGIGTAPYILGGIFLSVAALSLLLYSNISKRRKEVAGTS